MEDSYKTADYFFAAYLMYKGFFCLKAIPDEHPQFADRKVFVFIDIPNPKELEDIFYRGKPEEIVARGLLRRIRTAQDMIHTGLSQEELEALRKEKRRG